MDDEINDKSVPFTAALSKRLAELYGERIDDLESKSKKSSCSKRREAAWEEIAQILNAEGGSFSVNQVKKRWANIKGSCKEALWTNKKERDVTGGGGPPPKFNEVSEAVLNIIGTSRQFTGETSFVETNVAGKRSCSSAPPPSVIPKYRDVPEEANSSFQQLPKQASALQVDEIRKLQREALLSQIEANKAIIDTCKNVNSFVDQARNVLHIVEQSDSFRNMFPLNVVTEGEFLYTQL